MLILCELIARPGPLAVHQWPERYLAKNPVLRHLPYRKVGGGGSAPRCVSPCGDRVDSGRWPSILPAGP